MLDSRRCVSAWLAALILSACGGAPSSTEAQAETASAIGASGVSTVWERLGSYQGSRQVWDPSVMRWVPVDHNTVYQLDLAPRFLYTDRYEMWTTNFRCMHSNPADSLGWHRSYGANIYDWGFDASWCQRVDWDSGEKPATFFPSQNRWWTQASGANWGSIETWSNGRPVQFAIVRFTENKSIRDGNNVLRRAAPGPGNLDYWGYADIKMDRTPTDPAAYSANSVEDGFYQGFVTLGTIPVNAGSNWGVNATTTDLGPVVWPRRGYRQWLNGPTPAGHGANWQQTSTGCRHPHIFSWGGYLYIFYLSVSGAAPDGSLDSAADGGIFAARAALRADGTVAPFMCGASFDVPCMPPGYSKATRAAWEASLALPGPNVPPILDSKTFPGITSFAVAALAGTNPQRFVGVAETYDGARGSVLMFTSTDLVHWSNPSPALSWVGAWDAPATVHYPQPLNASTGDMSVVDGAQFYIAGGGFEQCGGGWPCRVNRITIRDF